MSRWKFFHMHVKYKFLCFYLLFKFYFIIKKSLDHNPIIFHMLIYKVIRRYFKFPFIMVDASNLDKR